MKNSISDYENTRLFDYEKVDIPFLNTPINKFERIKIAENKYFLLPTSQMYSTLYRGQTKIFDNCLPRPSLQREELEEDEIFIQNLKTTEFELMITKHPVVDSIFRKSGFFIDYLGLAQHYGLKTNLLDLTIDFDIAMFFATCYCNKKEDKYYPQMKPGNYTGVLYAHSTIAMCFESKPAFLSRRLNVIGLQPFKRPAAQKGFSLKFNLGDKFQGYEYTFSYTQEDSLYYYELFNKGESLLVKDELADKTKLLRDSNEYSLHALIVAERLYSSRGKGVSYYQDYLQKKGFKCREKDKLLWTFSEKDKIRIAENWNKNENKSFWESIVRRKEIVGGVTYPERDLMSLSAELMLRHIGGGKEI